MSQRVANDIKRIVERVIRANVMPDFVIGKVTEDDPIKIETSVNKKPYPEAILTIPDHVELKKDDSVILLRGLGGQGFCVLGTLGKQQEKEEEKEIPEDECPCGCGCKNYSKEPPKDDSEEESGSGGSGSDSGGSGKDKGDGNDSKEKVSA